MRSRLIGLLCVGALLGLLTVGAVLVSAAPSDRHLYSNAAPSKATGMGTVVS